jgi:sensor c-di-GMP phosphodiesterase-like protein
MRKYTNYALIAAAMLAAIVIPPWLAWNEARRQAFDIETSHTLAYAHDVIHRSDATAQQGAQILRALGKSGLAPCSPEQLRLMRRMDLANTYIQAVGHVRNGVIECSSLGMEPIPLGDNSYKTSTGYILYPNVPLPDGGPSPLFGIEGNGYAILIHRGLPVDTSVLEPDVSLGLFHMERQRIEIARGFIDPAWMPRIASQRETSFVDDRYLVTITRSSSTLVAAIAATPLHYVDDRAVIIARRLVPAALLGGLLVAYLIFTTWRNQQSIDNALRQALRRDEFYLVYQPIVDLDTGNMVGVEALLRWRNRNGEEVAPDIFIPVAERSKLILDLTDRVMQLVARDAGPYLKDHPHFHVAINLSAVDMQSPAILAKIERLIEHCGARPSNFILEITERSFLNLAAAVPVLQALHERAIEVAIDDFGTGYSSLSYLETLNVHYLKIDRSFIEAIGTGAPTSQVVGHIIEMARTMKLRMIAEGIESQAQAEFLRSRHVQFAQGWSYGKPMPFPEIVRRLAESERGISPAPYPAPS